MPNVVGYKAKWNVATHTGEIQVRTSYKGHLSTGYLIPQSAEEMHMLIDLLRNEAPLEYSSGTNELRSTDWEGVGEGE